MPGAFLRVFQVAHVICRYRLLSLLPGHPLLRLLVVMQWLTPSAWFGPRNLSDGERLQMALQSLGPIFIKFGQLLATRGDLLPPLWIEALSRLQDQVPPFPGEQARRIIEQELGESIDTLFDNFDTTPLASASVAQVHTAHLKTGQDVVVKVVRPGIGKVVERDLAVMRTGARWLETLWQDARYFRPSHVVRDYEQIIRGELDLAAEARNSETMRRHFLFSPLLHIPPVFMDLSTSRVMTMERIYGIPVNDIERIKAAGIDPRVLAERGVEIFFSQVFRFNFFHADMHPGNIFVNPAKPESPQYLTIDCAIVGRLSRQDLDILGRLALAVMRKDYGTLVDVVIRAGWSTAPIDRARFQRAVEDVVEPIMSQPLDQLEFAPLVMKLFDMARGFHIEAPIQYILLLKTLVHIEGLGRSIYPQLDIWTLGRPLLEQWMLEQYGPTATLKKIQDRLPEWAAQLPDLPDLFRDGLENLRDMPAQQRRHEARMEQLLNRHRRRQIAGLAGLGLLAAPLAVTTTPAWAPPALGAVLVWLAIRR